jgi:glycosyltransferase involved in cell wall biosynthesis
MIKVAFIHTSTMLNLRGSENYIILMSQLLRKKGFDVTILNFDYDKRYLNDASDLLERRKYIAEMLRGIKYQQLHGTRLYVPSIFSRSNNRFICFVVQHTKFLPLNRRVFKVLRESNIIYFVQVQSNPAYLLSFLTLGLLSGRKNVIAALHARAKPTAVQSSILKMFSRIGLLRVTRTFVREHRTYLKTLYGCDSIYIPSHIDIRKYPVKEKRIKQYLDVLFVGALTYKKGVDIIPAICNRLESKAVPYRLSVCSPGGPLKEDILHFTSKNKNAIYYGYLPRSELIDRYHTSHIMIVPSRDDQFPVVTLEAQACGTPVLVSDITGLRESVPYGCEYLLAKPADPFDFADKLQIIYKMVKDNPNQYRTLCTQSRKYVQDNFDEEKVLSDTLNMLLKVAVGKNAKSR